MSAYITRLKDSEIDPKAQCRVRQWCRQPVRFVVAYDYRNALNGGWSTRRTPCCEKHANGFAKRHGMTLPVGIMS